MLLFFFFLGPDRLTDASENVSDIFPLWHPTDPDAPISKNGRLNRFWPNPKPHRDTPKTHRQFWIPFGRNQDLTEMPTTERL